MGRTEKMYRWEHPEVVEERPKPVAFVDARSLALVRRWAIEDFVFQLEKRLVERCNIARSAQRSATDELSQKYWEGRADEVGEVILILEDLRRSRGGQL